MKHRKNASHSLHLFLLASSVILTKSYGIGLFDSSESGLTDQLSWRLAWQSLFGNWNSLQRHSSSVEIKHWRDCIVFRFHRRHHRLLRHSDRQWRLVSTANDTLIHRFNHFRFFFFPVIRFRLRWNVVNLLRRCDLPTCWLMNINHWTASLTAVSSCSIDIRLIGVRNSDPFSVSFGLRICSLINLLGIIFAEIDGPLCVCEQVRDSTENTKSTQHKSGATATPRTKYNTARKAERARYTLSDREKKKRTRRRHKSSVIDEACRAYLRPAESRKNPVERKISMKKQI